MTRDTVAAARDALRPPAPAAAVPFHAAALVAEAEVTLTAAAAPGCG